jgi:molybdopterin-guanine dinucleotide biosynthesis protein A
MNITGIILAGGKSTRMGQEKGLIEIAGKPMIQHVINHIAPLCDQILISANREEYKDFGYNVVKDVIKDIGPAGGIASCLPYSKHKKNIIISYDLPSASTLFIQRLLHLSEDYEITIPECDKHLQPLCGIYQKDIYPEFIKLVRNGHLALKYLVKRFNLKIVDETMLQGIDIREALRNINTEEDLNSP